MPLLLLLLLLWSGPTLAVTVTDGAGQAVTLARPAQRIVSLAPHVTELLFAAGAGHRLAGVVQFSDHPPQARALPVVGSYHRLDLERILAARPDLVVGWVEGNPPLPLAQLTALGIPVFRSQPRHLLDIPRELEALGRLAGSEADADRAAGGFRAQLQALARPLPADQRPRVFYQVWNEPLVTIGGEHLISEVITLCGGRNAFDHLTPLSPVVEREAVLAANPEVIVASGMAEERPAWLEAWRRWPTLRAVANNRLYTVPPDLIQRLGPRLVDGAALLCRHLAATPRR